MKESILHSIRAVPAIDLAELALVDFPSRTDTKFIFDPNLVPEFLESVAHDLKVLEVNGTRMFDYQNEYYDTAQFKSFADHQVGKGNRVKIRSRKYGEKGPFYLEIKHKNNKGETLKERLRLAQWADRNSEVANQFLKERISMGFEELNQIIPVNYSRVTFANASLTEKYTLDIGLHTVDNNGKIDFSYLAIAEVKQTRFSRKSPFMQGLKQRKIYPHKFSKYCFSVMHTHPLLKHNRFKGIVRTAQKIKLNYDSAA
ncbi:VTC domain-containing protein [bacterium SCSIO 12741]|nr:VTC domain-containing protein [bacterium SCSIO 12741]